MKSNFMLLGFVWMAILLMVLMPVSASISISYTNGEKDYRIYGIDKTDGFRKRTDSTESVVIIENDGSDPDVTPSQVKFETGIEFDSCSEINTTHVLCKHESPLQTLYSQDEFNTKVNVFDDSGMIVAFAEKMLRVDEEKPSFEKLLVSQELSSGIVYADIVLKDKGVSGKDYCSGFNELIVKDGSTTILTLTKDDFTDYLTDDCTYENTELEIPITSSGRKVLTFILTDGVGNSDSVQRTIDVDLTEPVFSFFRLMNDDGVEIHYARDDELYNLNAEFTFNSDDDVSMEAVFKGFLGDDDDQVLDGVCHRVRQLVTCSFSGIQLRLSDSQNVRVEYTVTDTYMNSLESALNYGITIDGESPIVNYFGTLEDVRDEEGTLYVGKNATFILDYTDYGIGVDKNSVFAVYDTYKSGATKVPADKCDLELSRCYWYVESDSGYSSLSGILGLHGDSSDSLGNVMEPQQINFLTDLDVPSVVESDDCDDDSCIDVFVSGSERSNYFKGGDYIDVEVLLEDTGVGVNPDNIYLDASGLVYNLAKQKGSCSQVSEGYKCTWNSIGPLVNSYDGSDAENSRELKIEIADRVGNADTIVRSMVVYKNPNLPDNFWYGVGVYSDIPAMDKQIMEVYSIPLLIPIYLKDDKCLSFIDNGMNFGCSENNDDINVVDVYFKKNSCSVSEVSSGEDGSDYISYLEMDAPYYGSPDLMASPTDDRLMFAKLKFKDASSAPDEDWIKYNCTMVVVSERNGFVYEEEEPVNLKVDFVKTGLGDIPAELEDEIANARDRAGGPLMSAIDFGGKLVETTQNLCSLYTKVSTLLLTVSYLKDVLDEGIHTKPYAVALGGGEEAIKMPLLEGIDKWLGPACKFVNCEHCQWTGSEADKAGFLPKGNIKLDNSGFAIKDNEMCSESWFGEKDGYDGSNVCRMLRTPLCYATVGSRFWNEIPGEWNNVDTSLNPKDSFGLSVLTVCIPGIVTGLQKYRQLDCQYIRCLEEDVPQGTDPFYCKAERAFNTCVWWGEGLMFIVYMIPGAQLLEIIGNLIEQFVYHPVQTSLGLGFKFLCKGQCTVGLGCGVCSTIQIVDVIADAVNTVWSYVDQGWDDMMENSVWPESPCDGLFDEDE